MSEITIEYIGTQERWPELALTGKQSVWSPGQIESRPAAEAGALLATGLFSSPPVPVVAVRSPDGGIGFKAGNADVIAVVGANNVAYHARASADRQRSAAYTRRDYDDNAAFTDAFADTSAWTMPATPGMQASGGKLYSVGTQGGGSGGNHSYALAAGENLRAVFNVHHVTGGSSGGMIVGVSSDAAGAIPASAGGNAFGLYFRAQFTTPQQVSSGVFSDISGAPALVTGDYIVTVTVDQWYISIVARLVGGTTEIRARRTRSGFTVNNLYIFNSDTRTLTGDYVNAVGVRKQFGSVSPRASIEGVGQSAHWTGDGTQDFKIVLPSSYDSRVPNPVCIMWHGNGSDENHFSNNSNGVNASSALLTAGYAVISCTYTANKASWGMQESLAAYAVAYRYFRDRYALGPLVFYANSMGSLESLLAIANGAIPGVMGWAATHPAVNLASAYADPFGVGFTASIKTAYGIASDGSDYATKTAGHDPMLLPVSSFKSVPMWVLYATDDAAVDQTASAAAFETKIKAAGMPITVTTTTGGHSASVSASMSAIVAFFNSCIGV